MRKVQLLLVLFAFSLTSVWAQKSPALDNQKALKNQIECQRIADLKLIKTDAPISINCQLDNMNYYSEVSLKEDQEAVRIGNFNLLHPGTDKTLFKDMGLVANLINAEFDVMAGVELVDVVAQPKANNLLILPIITQKAADLKVVSDQIQNHKAQIIELSIATEPVGPSEEELAVRKSLEQTQNSLKTIFNSIFRKNSELAATSADVATNSRPGTIVFGIELGKRNRLLRLAIATKAEAQLVQELSELQKQKDQIQNRIIVMEEKIRNFPKIGGISEANKLLIAKLKQTLSTLESDEKRLEQNLTETTRYYRIPGYLKILEELRKLDSSWSLIIAPHGDAAVESNAQELSGFYYRATKVGLSRNAHCSNQYNKASSGCYPNFYETYMGENKATLFSRRPFLATFTDGKKNFSLLAAHVVFESAPELEAQKEILQKTFNVSSLKELPTGINKQNYARFAETYLTMQLIEKLREEGLERIIYAGDFNLENQNPFWKYISEKLPGYLVLIDDQTSVSENRFVKGQPSNGVSSNYDHFILSTEVASVCKNASVVNFIENEYAEKIKEKYLVRIEATKGPYQLNPHTETQIAQRTQTINDMLVNYNFSLTKNNEIVIDTKTMTEDLNNFKERVFDSQLNDETYYKYFSQTMSDHLPIRMDCHF